MLTNRELAEKLGIPIGKIRRNTKEFLGEDPKATRRSGYSREFTINEGFYVYLGGILVTRYGLTFGQARSAIDIIKPWLLSNQLVPEPPKEAKPKGIDNEITDYFVSFPVYESQITNIFEVKGLKTHRKTRRTENFGRVYDEKLTSTYYYHVRNNSGIIEYFHPFQLDEDDLEIKKLDSMNRIYEVNVTLLLVSFLSSVRGRDKVNKHPRFIKP